MILWKLRRYLKPERDAYAGGLVAALLLTGTELFVPHLMG
jgi:hypothetical protein